MTSVDVNCRHSESYCTVSSVRTQSCIVFALLTIVFCGCMQQAEIDDAADTKRDSLPQVDDTDDNAELTIEFPERFIGRVDNVSRWFPVELNAQSLEGYVDGESVEWLEYTREDLTDELLAIVVQKFPSIQVLQIPHSPVTDEGLQNVARLEELSVLILGSASVTDAGIESFLAERADCIVRIYPKEVFYSLGLEDSPGVHLSIDATDEHVAAIAGWDEVDASTLCISTHPADGVSSQMFRWRSLPSCRTWK